MFITATRYNRETGRMTANYDVSPHDLADTFFPGFRNAVVEGGALGYMCSYSSVNGVPSCGSPYLETELMRGQWGLGNSSVGGSYIVSDCGAVQHIVDKHFNSSREAAVAQALNAGTDIVCNEDGMGGAYQTSMATALATNLTTEAALDASLFRSTMLHFRAGLFERDAFAGPFGSLKMDVVNSPAHSSLALEAAEQSLVLLKNRGGVLPFKVRGTCSRAPHPHTHTHTYAQGSMGCRETCVFCKPDHSLSLMLNLRVAVTLVCSFVKGWQTRCCRWTHRKFKHRDNWELL